MAPPAQYPPMSQQPNAASAPRPPKPRNNKVLIIVLCVALVVMAAITAALLVTRTRGVDGGASASTPSGPTTHSPTPVVTPQAPTFLDGMKQLTTLDQPNGGVIGATDNLVILYEIGDYAHPFAVDKNTGATVWQGQDGDCTIAAGNSLVCTSITDAEGNVDGWDWLDARTGQSEGALDLSSIGGVAAAIAPTSNGVLAIGDSNNDTGGIVSAQIAYFTGPGEPQWTTPVQYDTSGDRYWATNTFDEGQDLFAWQIGVSTYVLDENTGFLVYQAESITAAQIFSNRLVCVSSGDENASPSGNQQVDVPGSSPVTLTTCDTADTTIVPLGPGHPNILITDIGSVNGDITCTWAYDPANPLSSPLWSAPGGLCAPNVAWDGQSTVYAADGDGHVWAFDINTGNVLWQSSYQTDGGSGYGIEVFTSGGLVAVLVTSEGVLDFPAFTVMRADNGQQMPNLSGNSGFLQDGVLMTQSSASDAPTVYVPSFG